MRSKIRYDLLAKSQKYAKKYSHPSQKMLYQIVYKQLLQMRSHILRPFSNVCIHGNLPEQIIPILKQTSEKNKVNFWLHSHIFQDILKKQQNIKILDPQIPFNLSANQQEFDLIISCLVSHHYDLDKLMQNYNRRLKPDGAIIGCCWAENTLKQLQWSFMLAQNQRSGGVSPKVFSFPSIGLIGHSLTTTNFKMPTIIVRDLQIQVDSVVDILTLLQISGESGVLQGRRKGVYKDLLMAASAFYDTQFKKNSQIQQDTSKVIFSLELGLFIGWKQHENQPKPLSRRQVLNNSFFSQISKNDQSAKMYILKQGNQQAQEVDIKTFDKQTLKDSDPQKNSKK